MQLAKQKNLVSVLLGFTINFKLFNNNQQTSGTIGTPAKRGIHTYARQGEAKQSEAKQSEAKLASLHQPSEKRGDTSLACLTYVCMVPRVRAARRRFEVT